MLQFHRTIITKSKSFNIKIFSIIIFEYASSKFKQKNNFRSFFINFLFSQQN